jgi:uncharacterized protein
MSDRPWHSDGLRFKCTGCGKCCTGSPGYVWVTWEEIEAISKHLEMPLEEFTKQFVRRIGKRYSLTERPHSYDCSFLRDKQCTIYAVRPEQCRTFPFWPDILESKEAWDHAATYCEGINDDAPLIQIGES